MKCIDHAWILSALFRPDDPLPRFAWSQEKKNLRVVFVSLSWNAQLPFRIANATGFFRDQGLTVEHIFVRGGPTAVTRWSPATLISPLSAARKRRFAVKRSGLDINIISSTSNYTNYTLIGNKETKRTRRPARQNRRHHGRRTFSDFTIRLYLKRNNIEPDKDVILRAIGQTVVRASALEKGLDRRCAVFR